ncbi:MAG TPA: SusC/RagA family TonB-linked outer membrane protein, partial [Draconibacterium sp.]|nr:SusC/RagA family TonB-linked outer membrane protein [Draconibacterium sp.]
VIIITTKSGRKSQELKVSYKGYFGVDNVWQDMPMLGREDYQKTFNASRMNYNGEIFPGNDPNSPLYIDDVDTDWQDVALKTGTRQNHSLNLSGGGTYNTYNVSLDYYSSDGTLEGLGPEYNRYTARVKNTFEKGIVNLSTSLYYAHTDENSLGSTIIPSFSGAGRPPMIVDIISAIPTQKVIDEETGTWGRYEIPIHGQTYSLNIYGVNHDLDLETLADRVIGSGTAQLDFGKLFKWNNMGLKYKINGSYDRNVSKTFAWVPTFAYSDFFTNNVAKLDENAYFRSTSLIENTLNYNLESGNHKLDVLAGQMYQYESYNNITAHGEVFSKPYYQELSNAASTRASTYESEHIISSLLGRVNYNYADRYLLTATMRRDGSSRFSEDNRFGYFPSVALAWRINNENFFNVSEDFISSLKLRASWGQLGNENIGNYAYMVSINRNAYYNFTNSKIQGGTQTDVVATDIKWETKEMTNIGVDAILFNGKIDFSAEYYKSRSEDLLVAVAIPRSVGSLNSSPVQNAGTLENSGFEFTATYHGTGSDFNYDITGNLSTLNNKVINLGNNGAPLYGSGSINIEGQEVGQHFGYVYDGIFQTPQEVSDHAFQTAGTAPGDIRFKNLNDDNVINSDDRTTLGSAIPDLTFGLNFSANYKNWDFSLFVNGAVGFLINDNIYRHQMHTSGGLNWREDILNYWREDNKNTTVPRVVDTDPNDNDRNSDRPGWLQKGDYLKFNNFTVGYTLPDNVVGKVFSRARIYATAQNFYILTKYEGYNPDFSGGVTSPGYNFGSYPTPRTLLLGVNLDF